MAQARYTQLLIWVFVCTVLVVIVSMMTIVRVRAELCLPEVDDTIAKKSGYRWQYRTVDGRKCWFYSNRLLPQSDLIWSYRSHDFDADVRVIERRYYWPELLDGELKLRD